MSEPALLINDLTDDDRGKRIPKVGTSVDGYLGEKIPFKKAKPWSSTLSFLNPCETLE